PVFGSPNHLGGGLPPSLHDADARHNTGAHSVMPSRMTDPTADESDSMGLSEAQQAQFDASRRGSLRFTPQRPPGQRQMSVSSEPADGSESRPDTAVSASTIGLHNWNSTSRRTASNTIQSNSMNSRHQPQTA